jgi:hypothetical protein
MIVQTEPKIIPDNNIREGVRHPLLHDLETANKRLPKQIKTMSHAIATLRQHNYDETELLNLWHKTLMWAEHKWKEIKNEKDLTKFDKKMSEFLEYVRFNPTNLNEAMQPARHAINETIAATLALREANRQLMAIRRHVESMENQLLSPEDREDFDVLRSEVDFVTELNNLFESEMDKDLAKFSEASPEEIVQREKKYLKKIIIKDRLLRYFTKIVLIGGGLVILWDFASDKIKKLVEGILHDVGDVWQLAAICGVILVFGLVGKRLEETLRKRMLRRAQELALKVVDQVALAQINEDWTYFLLFLEIKLAGVRFSKVTNQFKMSEYYADQLWKKQIQFRDRAYGGLLQPTAA